jgi:hypothetical protein
MLSSWSSAGVLGCAAGEEEEEVSEMGQEYVKVDVFKRFSLLFMFACLVIISADLC